jgi:hypothetical protein
MRFSKFPRSFGRDIEGGPDREIMPSVVAGGDLAFLPLRSLNSPLSVERIRAVVAERVAAVSFWTSLRGLIFEWIALGTLALCVSSLSTRSVRVAAGPASNHAGLVSHGASAEPARTVVQSATLASRRALATASTPRLFAIVALPATLPAGEVEAPSLPAIHSAEGRITPVATIADVSPKLDPAAGLRSATFRPDDKTHVSLFARMDAGFLFQDFRMTSEGAQIGLTDGWKTIAIEARIANSRRDLHDLLLHHSSNEPLRWSETEQQIGLQLGIEQHFGSVSARATMGPGYWISNMTLVDPISGSQSATSLQRFGVTAEASIAYSITQAFQAGVTGIASYHGSFDSGALLTISFSR